jgi:hypothetical protein
MVQEKYDNSFAPKALVPNVDSVQNYRLAKIALLRAIQLLFVIKGVSRQLVVLGMEIRPSISKKQS